MIRILKQDYGYSDHDLSGQTYAKLRALLSEERQTKKESFSDDGADLYPNGRDFDAEDENSW